MALAEIDVTPDALPLDSIICGDCLGVLRTLPDNSIDAIVTDPPAGIGFMGKGWDSNKGGRDAWIAWLAEVMAEALRVLKPGGHGFVWALPRTSHWTATALEDAGWEIRDCCTHLFGSGFPKSLDVSKAIDKVAGAQRAKIGQSVSGKILRANGQNERPYQQDHDRVIHDITAPATDAAKQWDGWGTALKPAAEFWWLCRKPLAEKTVAANVLRWGTGALNIGASRVGSDTSRGERYNGKAPKGNHGTIQWGPREEPWKTPVGRWPANLLLSHAPDCTAGGCSLWCPIRALDAQSAPNMHSAGHARKAIRQAAPTGMWAHAGDGQRYGDNGGASRFFTTFRYTAKASRSERNRGCSSLPKQFTATMNDGVGQRHHSPDEPNAWNGNHHPTVKPLALMSWLIGLITPPGGIVLDPFAGSGSTLCAAKAGGWRYIGIEKESEYITIAHARVQAS